MLRWVTFLIMAFCGLANAGVEWGGGGGGAPRHRVALGVVLGLVVGRLIGVTLFAPIAIAWGVGGRPAGVRDRHLVGAGALAGIGFTMSLFIASLAFGDSELLDVAKIGVLGASLVAGLAGTAILVRAR